jgi:UDP-N-acetylmuramoylalanine-D-glutamate ligase
MISRWFPDAVLFDDLKPEGLCNVIQAAKPLDILYVRAKNEEQLNSLLDLNLSTDFRGLIVSPYKPIQKKLSYALLSLEDMNNSENELMDEFYPLPKDPKKLIGITGTNGKTSVCWYCMEIGKLLGERVLYMGTIGVYLNGKKTVDKILTTTPSLLSLRKLQQ